MDLVELVLLENENRTHGKTDPEGSSQAKEGEKKASEEAAEARAEEARAEEAHPSPQHQNSMPQEAPSRA